MAGRTSPRPSVRPSNAPKPWAAPIVKQYALNAQRLRTLTGSPSIWHSVGATRPVAHRAVCSPCHGVEEKLNPEVRKELKDRYVVDHATGFRKGWRPLGVDLG